MCGVFFWHPKTCGQAPDARVSDALDALGRLRHRGPDGQHLAVFDALDASDRVGRYTLLDSNSPEAESTDWRLAMGHARLSIIDRSHRADQPMAYRTLSGRWLWMVYNGEVYNYRALRESLLARGYAFSTDADTEVLLALYDAEGERMVELLNGMFAFVLWDPARHRVFAARDRYGVKPLYYARLGDGLAMASEIKALVNLPGFEKRVNPKAVFDHFTFQHALDSETMMAGVFRLMPGQTLSWDTGARTLHLDRYWRWRAEPGDFDLARADEMARQVEASFDQAVRRQLVGDVPIGSFLSGGMDTAAVTQVAAGAVSPLDTFTCGFDVSGMTGMEAAFDERAAARALADRLKTRHHETVIGQDVLPEIFASVVWHLDDPCAGISYPVAHLARFASRSVTAVLSGVGGDELFAGYPWRYLPVLGLRDPAQFEEAYYGAWQRLLSDAQKRALFTPGFLSFLGDYDTRGAFIDVLAETRGEHPLHRAMAYDFGRFLPALLTVDDRLSMAWGLESRVPFLDNDLVDLCLQLPADSKLRMENGAPVAKWILKRAFAGRLPEPVLNRPKQGFTPPDASWYRTVHRGWIEAILLSERALGRGIFQEPVLRQLLLDHFSGDANHRFLIWSLLCFEQWQRHFIDA